MSKIYVEYGEKEITYLKGKCKKLAEVIERVGFIERERYQDLFDSLINAIVGQQISRKAHITIYNRIIDLLGTITPKTILNCADDKLQSCGLTHRKVDYMKNFASLVDSGEFDINSLQELSDDEVCEKLSALRGIGVWTAQMLMIFTLGRKDIIAYDDLIIQRGLRMIYHHKKIDKKLFQKYKKRYSPYGSIASLYLWKVGNGELEGYKDYAPKPTQKRGK